MPSVTTNFIITSVSAALTSAIILAAFAGHVTAFKNQVEDAKLQDIAVLISSQAVKAVTSADASNIYSNVTLNLPQTIGSKPYWVKLNNDTQRAWIDLGLGSTVINYTATTYNSKLRYYLPFQASAQGTFRSGYGVAFLVTSKVGGVYSIRILEKLH